MYFVFCLVELLNSEFDRIDLLCFGLCAAFGIWYLLKKVQYLTGVSCMYMYLLASKWQGYIINCCGSPGFLLCLVARAIIIQGYTMKNMFWEI